MGRSRLIQSRYGETPSHFLRPPVWFIVILAVLVVPWYMFFLSLGISALGATWTYELLGPSVILGANSYVRGMIKWREFMADRLAITEPVGRRVDSIRVRLAILGTIAGVAAGVAFALSTPYRSLGVSPVLAPIGMGLWEFMHSWRLRTYRPDPDLIESCVLPPLPIGRAAGGRRIEAASEDQREYA